MGLGFGDVKRRRFLSHGTSPYKRPYTSAHTSHVSSLQGIKIMKYILKSRSGRKGGSPRRAYPGDGYGVPHSDLYLALPTDALAGISERGEKRGERQRRGTAVPGRGVGPGVSQKILRPILLCLCPLFPLLFPLLSAAGTFFSCCWERPGFLPPFAADQEPARSEPGPLALNCPFRAVVLLHSTGQPLSPV